MPITTYTDSNYSALFKRTYGEYGDNLYGSGAEDPIEAAITKYFDFGGLQHEFPLKLGFGGNTGFGSLPETTGTRNVNVILTRKKAYARIQLDRETIVASRGKASAFKEATSEATESALKSFIRTQACAAYNDGTGILGQFSGNATGTAAAPVVTILNTGNYQFRQAYFEEDDLLQVVTNSTTLQATSLFQVTAVNVVTRAITLSRITGAVDLTAIGAGTHALVLQGSFNLSPMGLLGVVNFASGNLYSVPFQRRFSPYILPAGAGLISVDLLNQAMLQIDQRAGMPPTHFIFSVKQMEKFLNQLEDKKRYTSTTVDTRSNKLATKATVSFSAIEMMGVRGPITIVSSRYVRDDMVLAVNMDKCFRKHAEKFGWFEEDGSVLLRLANADAYEARYGGYYENFFNVLYFGAITGLASA